MKNILVLFVLMSLAGFSGYLLQQKLNDSSDPSATQSAPIGSAMDMLFVGMQRPEFSLPDAQGNLRNITEWDGNVIVLNFWATWCPPCRKELPTFVDLQNRYGDQGLQFIGLAVDTPENVSEFVQTLPLNFPNLIDEVQTMKIAALYGNDIGALPYTVIIDRQGRIVFTHKGELKAEEAEKLIGGLFKQSELATAL